MLHNTKKTLKGHYKKFVVASLLLCKQEQLVLAQTSSCRKRDYSLVLGNNELVLADFISDASDNYLVMAGQFAFTSDTAATASVVIELDISACTVQEFAIGDLVNGVQAVHLDKNGDYKYAVAGLTD